MLTGALLFVLGFSVVFVGLGVLSGSVSQWFFVHGRTFDVVLGVLAIVLGLAFLGFIPWMQRDVRVHAVPAVGLAAAPALGFLFALGWAPCIGPTLGVILTLATFEDGPRGGLLLAFYSLGLGVPFVLAALGYRRALGASAWVRRHQFLVTALGGGMLILIGVLLLTGWWAEAVGWVQVQLVDELRGAGVTATETAVPTPPAGRRSGELTPRELLRWAWRQLTSMRTALILLLLLALAAVPGSVVPQERVDSLGASQWRDSHETLTPVYEKLGLFDVYGSPWFAAIYLLLVVSLVGCIVPRSYHYLRAARAEPPPAPRNLSRLPDHATYDSVARRRTRCSTGPASCSRTAATGCAPADGGGRGERRARLPPRGREPAVPPRGAGGAGRLRARVAVRLSRRGACWSPARPSRTTRRSTTTSCRAACSAPTGWTRSCSPSTTSTSTGCRRGWRAGFSAQLRYQETRDAPEQSYDLRVNHPLTIGDTELFLIGHGYAPVVTVRDGNGDVAYSGPTIFLPQGPDMLSFGVVKAPDAKPDQIGLEGLFFPTFVLDEDGDPANLMGDDINPLLSLNVYTGDLGLDDGDLAVGLRARQEHGDAGARQGRSAAADRPRAGRHGRAAGRAGLGHVRGGRAVAADPDQPDAGQGDRAARRRAGADRADGLAVHPVPPGLGAGRRRR